MGMARVAMEPKHVVPSKTYPRCWFCPSCMATYSPNMEWGYRVTSASDRSSTSSSFGELHGVRRLGDECPFCGREPEPGVTL